MMVRCLPTLAATACTALALGAGPATAADVGDFTPLDSEVGVDNDVGLNEDAPISDVTSDIPASITTDVDVGETPDYGLTVDGQDEVPQVGDSIDVDIAADDSAQEEALLGDVDTAPGEDIIDAPDVDEVPELGVTDREEDPIADDVEILPGRRGFEN